MAGKKLLLLSAVFLIVPAAVLLSLGLGRVFPKNPADPYIVDSGGRVSGVYWSMARFQPVYLFSQEKNGRKLLWTGYRDNQGKVRMARVLVGGDYKGTQLEYAPMRDGNDAFSAAGGMDGYNKILKSGKRFSVQFFVDVKGFRGKHDLATPEAQEICAAAGRFCRLAGIIGEHEGDVFQRFIETGKLERRVLLPALVVSANLVR